ncbi:MAG: hypothetical protein QOC59_1745 [Microbacteriaceae bacterium]|jgi:hypothetical protein|nr:hypothetical protein [Microbacteriaceae bacterium]
MTTSPPLAAPVHPSLATATAAPPRRLEPRTLLLVGAAVAAASLAVAVVGLVADPRQIAGSPAWLKPAKFGVSITVYLVTLQWILSFVRGHRRLLLVVTGVTLVALVVEIVLIDLQVVRGTTSHFNKATAFDTAVYNAMGGLISSLFVVAVIAAVLLLRTRGLDAGIAAGMRWGLLLALLGMLEAVLMTVNFGWSDGGGHTVGASDGGPGLPITGWSTEHGDLRIAHFVGLHALQVLPILAWLLTAVTSLGSRTRVRLLAVAGAGYGGAMLLLTWQALRGQALLSPDGPTLVAAAALALLVLAGTRAALGSATRRAAES